MVTDIYVLRVSMPQLAWIYVIFCVIGAAVVTAVLVKLRRGGAVAIACVWAAAIAASLTILLSGCVPTAATVRVTQATLSISAPLNPSVTVHRPDVEWVRMVNLSLVSGLKPSVKVFGTDIPGGIKVGWFRLSNGAKAYVLSSGCYSEALVIKLKNGSYVEVLLPRTELAGLVKALRTYSWIG